MKRIIFCTVLLIFATGGFSQQTIPTAPPLTKTDYLQKSKKQKTTAWILLGVGTIATGIGIGWAKLENDIGDNSPTPFIILASAGAVAMLGSIPLFVASSKNKNKAMTLSFKNEFAPQIQKSSLIYHCVPSLNVKISL